MSRFKAPHPILRWTGNIYFIRVQFVCLNCQCCSLFFRSIVIVVVRFHSAVGPVKSKFKAMNNSWNFYRRKYTFQDFPIQFGFFTHSISISNGIRLKRFPIVWNFIIWTKIYRKLKLERPLWWWYTTASIFEYLKYVVYSFNIRPPAFRWKHHPSIQTINTLTIFMML